MDIKTSLRFLRWLLITLSIGLGGVLGFAQTKAAQPNKLSAHDQVLKQNPPKKDWIKDPNKVMPMRQMTNAQRRAAAQRNQARRAKVEAQQKLSAPAKQGVQQ
jgi:hypothetical protein